MRLNRLLVAFTLISLTPAVAVSSPVSRRIEVRATPSWRLVDPITGGSISSVTGRAPRVSIDLSTISSSRIIIRSNLPGFKVFRSGRPVSRAALRKGRTFQLSFTPRAGRYKIGINPYATQKLERDRVALDLRVTKTIPPSTPPNYSPAPNLASKTRWQSNMLNFGSRFCNRSLLEQLSTWEGSVWYYDGIRVYQQIAKYTNNPDWLGCAALVRNIYRTYVLDNQGRIGGWRVFPDGLLEDWRKTGDPLSRNAVVQLATNSAFASQSGGSDPELSRETAYLIRTYIAASEAGSPQSARLSAAVNYAIGHLRRWRLGETGYVKPFMMALTFEALITYERTSGDSRMLPEIRAAAEWLATKWQGNQGAFPYIICSSSAASSECSSADNEDSADLNLLIAPVYGWLYLKTGDESYRVLGDEIFNAGVDRAWLGNGKQFSQNYRWSFDYLRWREGQP
jgi:hypothetical protein